MARWASVAAIFVALGVTLAFGQEDLDDLGQRLLATPGVRMAVDAAIDLEAKAVADEPRRRVWPAAPRDYRRQGRTRL